MIPRTLVPSDRRFALLVLTAVLAIVLGFFTFTPEHAVSVVTKIGYWAMLLITGLFVWSLVKIGRASWPGWPVIKTWPRWPAGLIGACGTVLLVHEPYGFKILMDEVMLLGTSMSMHFDKVPLVPMRGNDINGAFQVMNGYLDKRPLFQPFLTSIFHDFLGYRPENVFVLNTLLTFLLLALAYQVGRRIAGRAAGAVAVLMLTTLPLLAQNATGGGFEVLNLVMILATVLLGMRFLRSRDADSQEAFCLSAVLLSQTRYESVLFLLPVAAIVVYVWWLQGRPVLSWVFCGVPLYMLPYALHNKVFSVRQTSWELESRPEFKTVFSLSYVPDNLGHALNFFFNLNGQQSNSLVISVLGLLAAPFFLLWAVRTLRAAGQRDPARVVLAVFALGFALHTALLMCYFWGKFDDPVIRRLSLPANLALVLGVVAVVADMGREWIYRVLLVVSLAGLFAHGLPSMARHDFSLEYYVGRETDWRREFIAAHPERDYLVVDNSSIFWITHLVSATPFIQANEHKDNLLYHWKNHTFSAVYVFQRFDVDDKTGQLAPLPDEELSPDYTLETVWERRFTPLKVSRISRITSVREGPTTMPKYTPPAIEKMTAAQLEKVRQQYFEKFIQKLP